MVQGSLVLLYTLLMYTLVVLWICDISRHIVTFIFFQGKGEICISYCKENNLTTYYFSQYYFPINRFYIKSYKLKTHSQIILIIIKLDAMLEDQWITYSTTKIWGVTHNFINMNFMFFINIKNLHSLAEWKKFPM